MEIFVPGRLAIQGEHTDWMCTYRGKSNPFIDIGLCLVAATNEGIYARVSQTSDVDEKEKNAIFIFEHTDCKDGKIHSFENEYNLHALEEEARREDSFFSYVAGAAASVLETYFSNDKRGFVSMKISNYKTTLPMGRGLSSSAAISVLVVKCFNAVYKLNLTLNEIMSVAFRGERKTRSECGMMDFCTVMGQERVALMVMAESGYCRLNLIKNKKPLHFVVADLRANPPKNTVEILSHLNDCFPLPKGCGNAFEEQACMHEYAHESARLCLNSVEAIESGDIYALAASMRAAQSSFDKGGVLVCPTQLQSPHLRRAIDAMNAVPGALAAKGVGSQGDGSVQVLCEDEHAQARVLDRLSKPDIGAEGFFLTLPAIADGDENGFDLRSNRVAVAVLMVSAKYDDSDDSDSFGTGFSLDTVSASEAAILSCGIEKVYTVLCDGKGKTKSLPANIECSTTGLVEGDVMGASEKTKITYSNMTCSTEIAEQALAYENFLRKGRLKYQAERIHASMMDANTAITTLTHSIGKLKLHSQLNAHSPVLLCLKHPGGCITSYQVFERLRSSLGHTSLTATSPSSQDSMRIVALRELRSELFHHL